MSDLIQKIQDLKQKRHAVILAHNYQRPDVQDIADYTGDSLGLALSAATTKAEVIVFCGVHFMAETAAITCPNKTVLLPDENSGCPMANMITPRELREWKKQFPGAVVVTYVNSSAAVKAESDYCCTSSNAVALVNAIPGNQDILFCPDQSLGSWVARNTTKNVILWPGYCPTHHRIRAQDVRREREIHPDAKVVVHPECLSEVVDMADKVCSTTGMLKYCRESSVESFLIGTEIALLHRLAKENPGKRFYPLTTLADCPNMKLNTLEKILWSLEDLQPVVTVPSHIAERASVAINRMLDVTE